jgi:ketosteroid isomerase-like protein
MANGFETTTAGRSDNAVGGPRDENVEIVKHVMDAFNRRDIDAVLEHADPGVSFLPIVAQVLHSGTPYRGPAGVRAYFDDIKKVWRDVRLDPRQFQAAGAAVVVIGYVQASTDEVELELPVVWTWKLRDALITECVVHCEQRAARRALGFDDQ